MSLIVYKRPIIQFNLYTTKPFHSRKSAIDFLRLIRSYGPYYLPIKYDFFEPVKQIFNSNDEQNFVRIWFGGSEMTDQEAQERNCEGGFIAKGKPPSKIDYHIMWEHKEDTDRFNIICVSIAIPFLKKAANIWRNLFTFAMIYLACTLLSMRKFVTILAPSHVSVQNQHLYQITLICAVQL